MMERELLYTEADGSQVYLVGSVCVDTGVITVIDPCNAEAFDFDREVVAADSLEEDGAVAHTKPDLPEGASYAVTVQTATGDGFYPVVLVVSPEGRPVRVTVDLENRL